MVQHEEVSKKLIEKKVLTVNNRIKGLIHLSCLCSQMKEWQQLLRQLAGFDFWMIPIPSLLVYLFPLPGSRSSCDRVPWAVHTLNIIASGRVSSEKDSGSLHIQVSKLFWAEAASCQASQAHGLGSQSAPQSLLTPDILFLPRPPHLLCALQTLSFLLLQWDYVMNYSWKNIPSCFIAPLKLTIPFRRKWMS